MNKFFTIFILAGLMLVVLYIAVKAPKELLAPSSNTLVQGTACIRAHCFKVDFATTEAQREKGLMFVTHLDADRGMFFIFSSEDVYPFWMKNTLIPLDIIWLDKNLRVATIVHSLQPCGNEVCPPFNPGVRAQYVLEINGGVSQDDGFQVGDQAILHTP